MVAFYEVFLYVVVVAVLAAFAFRVYYHFYWSELPPKYDPKKTPADAPLELDPKTYPNRGLYKRKFPSPSEFAQLTLEKQAEYASVFPRRYGMREDYLDRLYESLTHDSVQLSITTLGNIAYLSRLHPTSRWVTLQQDVWKRVLEDKKTT